MDIGVDIFLLPHSWKISWRHLSLKIATTSSNLIAFLDVRSYGVLAMSKRASLSIERRNGCTRGSIHIALNIMTLCKKLKMALLDWHCVMSGKGEDKVA